MTCWKAGKGRTLEHEIDGHLSGISTKYSRYIFPELFLSPFSPMKRLRLGEITCDHPQSLPSKCQEDSLTQILATESWLNFCVMNLYFVALLGSFTSSQQLVFFFL